MEVLNNTHHIGFNLAGMHKSDMSLLTRTIYGLLPRHTPHLGNKKASSSCLHGVLQGHICVTRTVQRSEKWLQRSFNHFPLRKDYVCALFLTPKCHKHTRQRTHTHTQSCIKHAAVWFLAERTTFHQSLYLSLLLSSSCFLPFRAN